MPKLMARAPEPEFEAYNSSRRSESFLAATLDLCEENAASIALFDTPIFMGFYSISKFEQLAHEVLQLILRGITRQ